MIHSEKRALALAIHEIGALKFGQFTLKSGITSPFYIDLRLLISHPEALALSGTALAQAIIGVEYDRLAAIPYAGLPIGTALALTVKRPLIFPRKDKKDHGLGKQIEGEFNVDERALVIDDLITKGDAKLEAIAPLRQAGLIVSDVAVLIDRQSGGVQTLAAAGIAVHPVLRLSELLDILQESGKLERQLRQTIDEWLKDNS
ncbi:MAG: orotate phosphoribosyltransferase [Aggregatilineales bacterium]